MDTYKHKSHVHKGCLQLSSGFLDLCTLQVNRTHIPSKKSSAQVGVWVNFVLTRNGYIKCYISLFKEIIWQQCDAIKTEMQDPLTKPCAFKVSRGHPSKMVKLAKCHLKLKTLST